MDEAWPQEMEGIRRLRIDEISPNPYQPRRQRDADGLAQLSESVREHGILQPLVVRVHDSGYQLIAGERRLLAAQQAGLREVPVVVRECGDREMLELALVENLQRQDINCIESAWAYSRLIQEFGITQEEVATRLGRSRPSVANTLRLLSLPQRVQESLLAGKISEGLGRALLALDDADVIIALCERIEREGLSVRRVEAMTRPRPEPQPVSRETVAAGRGLDANGRLLQDRLRQALGTKVTIRARGESGAIEIEYYSEEDLDRISAHILREERSDDSLVGGTA